MATGNWVEQAVNFAVFVLLARLLGAEAFGLLAMAAAFVLLSEFLVRESLSDFLIAHASPDDAHMNATFWMLTGFGAVLTVVLILSAGPISVFYGQNQVQGLIVSLSPTVLMIALTAVPVAILRKELRFRTLSLRAIAGVVAGGVVSIVMALNGYGVWSLAGQRLAQVFVNVVMAWLAVDWRPGIRFSRAHSTQVIRFGGTVLGLRAAELASVQLPSVIIGATLGPGVLGFFSIAWRMVEIGSFLIVTPLRLAAQPAFAALKHSGRSASDLLINIARLSGLLAFAAFAGLSVLASPLLALLFGPGWQETAPILSILSILGAYFCIEKINQAYCLAMGRAGATTLVAWAEVGLASLLVWVLSPWGVVAMTAGMVTAFMLFWPLRFVIVARLGSVAPWSLARTHILPLIGAIFMWLVVAVVIARAPPTSPLGTTLLGTGVGVVVFVVFSYTVMSERFALLKSFVAPQKKPVNNRTNN